MVASRRRQSNPTDEILQEPPAAGFDTLKALLPYLSEYKSRIVVAMICLVIAKIASVGLPFILKYIVDDLNSERVVGANSVLLVPVALLVAYGLVRFANVLFAELRDTVFGRVTERAMRRAGHRAFVHLHNLDLAFHLTRRTGGVARDIERGVSGIGFLLRFMVFNIVPTFIEIAFIVVLLVTQYSLWFALIVVCSVGAYVWFSVVATEWRTKTIRAMNQAESQSSTRAVDSLLNYETVKYFNNEAHEADLYDQNLAEWELARRRNRLTLFALNSGQSAIIAIGMTAAMVLAAFRVANAEMTIGDFVLINALMMQIFVPLNFLGFVYREMKGSLASIDAMFALMRKEPAVKDIASAPDLVVGEAGVAFENVSFAYDSERPILQKINFAVPPRKKLAIVGPSGSGKSTILKLLMRFYDVDEGVVRIDGQAVNSVTQASLRQAIAVVPQDAVLFNATILDNVKYGNISASEEDILAALETAALTDFVSKLPSGLLTEVGERGLKLSGGEKQRIAIARAVLKRPAIMVFDEATSSLDSKAERQIVRAMSVMREKYTTIVIAHRLSTIVDADHIIVLADGHIVEQGTHVELLQKEALYHSLWHAQNEAQSDDLDLQVAHKALT